MDRRIVVIAAWSRPADGFPADFGERGGRSRGARPGRGWRCRVVERALSLTLLHGADPPWLLDDCVSQGPDPVLKPLCLRHHHLGVVGAERNSRHTLEGGEQMDREFSRILFMANGPELLL